MSDIQYDPTKVDEPWSRPPFIKGQELSRLYYEQVVQGHQMSVQQKDAAKASAQAELQTAFGDQTPAKLDVAKAVLRKFGDEGFMKYLEDSGLGNNVNLIRILSNIGENMMEDSARGGGGAIETGDQATAINTIKTLRVDTEFMAALTTDKHPGHRAAVERWENIHKVAYPGKVSSQE